MRRETLHFSQRLRYWFYGVFVLLWLTGGYWLILDGSRTGEFGGETNPLQPWLLKIHGAAAMMGLIVLGVILPVHVKRSWAARRNRMTGAFVVSACVALVFTGYGLYYVGDDSVRRLCALAHDTVGLFLPPVIALHVVFGRGRYRLLSPKQGVESAIGNLLLPSSAVLFCTGSTLLVCRICGMPARELLLATPICGSVFTIAALGVVRAMNIKRARESLPPSKTETLFAGHGGTRADQRLR